MSNIFDYLDWRDINMDMVPFNEVDNLILARLSYFPFDGIVENEPISIKEIYEKYSKISDKAIILQEEDKELFSLSSVKRL